MKDILGRIATKRSLTKLLMNVAEGHFRKRNVSFSIEGNWSHSSSAGIGTTNRTEGVAAIMVLITIKVAGEKSYGSWK